MAVPSVGYLGDAGLVVGHAAQRRATTDPSRVARELKRRVGDPTPILVGGGPAAADLLMARLLDWVVGQVTGWEGGPPNALAVTHPANWGRRSPDQVHRHQHAASHTCVLRASDGSCSAGVTISRPSVPTPGAVPRHQLGGAASPPASTRDSTVTWWGVVDSSDDPEGELASTNAADSAVCGVRTDDTVACWGFGPVTDGPPPSGP